MRHTFSPLRCLSKWLFVPALLLFALGFALGRHLCVGVNVIAVQGGKRVRAEILLDGTRHVGTTPCRVPGRAGEIAQLTLKHGGKTVTTVWAFSHDHPDCVVEFPALPVALVFVAYDTQGNEIEAIVEGEDIPRHTTKQRSRLTRVIGDKVTIRFEPRDPKCGPAREEEIVWQDKETFDEWVDGELLTRLADLDPDYNRVAWEEQRARLKRYSSEAAHERPIIFRRQAGE